MKRYYSYKDTPSVGEDGKISSADRVHWEEQGNSRRNKVKGAMAKVVVALGLSIGVSGMAVAGVELFGSHPNQPVAMAGIATYVVGTLAAVNAIGRLELSSIVDKQLHENKNGLPSPESEPAV